MHPPTTLHIKLAGTGPACGAPKNTLLDCLKAGYAGFWNARQVVEGDTLRIHWEGDEQEPAMAASFTITRLEEVAYPSATGIGPSRVVFFDQTSTRDVVHGICPDRPKFNQTGMAYTRP